MKIMLLTFCCCALATCEPLREYNSHVAAREDSLSGFSKDGNYGGEWTHRVEYR